ncbi:stage V sporulation protein AC [Clostridium sp. SYSU_GA19001]|uniref:stage V sporulation protein AC n=1 Tax=Clostridium caldaquaticum TaxID=2940653 RepID=UPI002076D6DB|nr:stage V sporulation protein AC [Clostridium caldaquaticum]
MDKKEERIKQRFQTLSSEVRPKSNIIKNCFNAFWIGGLICTIGQLVSNYLINIGVPKDDVSGLVSIVMVFIGALLTGIGVYDKIAKIGGAGTLVPITGFSNAIVSPAMEFKKEGFIFGAAAKMFVIAGPVLVYGIGSSVIVGIIYYFIK